MKLLHELENGAASDEMPIGTLLRKCLILAHRLRSKPATDWVERELNGYGPDDDVPDYRKLSLIIKAEIVNYTMRHSSWTVPPALLGKHRDNVTNITYRESVGEVEHFLRSGKGGNISVSMGDLALLLNNNEAITGQVLSAWGEADASQLANILEAVRNRVLMFVLNLEREFPDAGEVEATAMATKKSEVDHIFHTTIYGSANLVGTNNANVVMNITKGDFRDLKQTLEANGVSAEDIVALKDAIDAEPEMKGKSFGPKVAKWIGSMMSKAADGTWKMATGAAGSVLGKALEKYYGLS